MKPFIALIAFLFAAVAPVIGQTNTNYVGREESAFTRALKTNQTQGGWRAALGLGAVDGATNVVFLSARTDGTDGDGTSITAPRDASTANKLDAIIYNMRSNTVYVLLPGTYASSFTNEVQPKSNVRIMGSGMDLTTVRYNGSNGAFSGLSWLNSTTDTNPFGSFPTNIIISDLTIDANKDAYTNTARPIGGIFMTADRSKIERVRLIGIRGGSGGTTNAADDVECFGLTLIGDPTKAMGGGNAILNCVVDLNLNIETNYDGSGYVTAISVGYAGGTNSNASTLWNEVAYNVVKNHGTAFRPFAYNLGGMSRVHHNFSDHVNGIYQDTPPADDIYVEDNFFYRSMAIQINNSTNLMQRFVFQRNRVVQSTNEEPQAAYYQFSVSRPFYAQGYKRDFTMSDNVFDAEGYRVFLYGDTNSGRIIIGTTTNWIVTGNIISSNLIATGGSWSGMIDGGNTNTTSQPLAFGNRYVSNGQHYTWLDIYKDNKPFEYITHAMRAGESDGYVLRSTNGGQFFWASPSAGGMGQSPWTGQVDAATFYLTNAGGVSVGPANAADYLFGVTARTNVNTPAGGYASVGATWGQGLTNFTVLSVDAGGNSVIFFHTNSGLFFNTATNELGAISTAMRLMSDGRLTNLLSVAAANAYFTGLPGSGVVVAMSASSNLYLTNVSGGAVTDYVTNINGIATNLSVTNASSGVALSVHSATGTNIVARIAMGGTNYLIVLSNAATGYIDTTVNSDLTLTNAELRLANLADPAHAVWFNADTYNFGGLHATNVLAIGDVLNNVTYAGDYITIGTNGIGFNGGAYNIADSVRPAGNLWVTNIWNARATNSGTGTPAFTVSATNGTLKPFTIELNGSNIVNMTNNGVLIVRSNIVIEPKAKLGFGYTPTTSTPFNYLTDPNNSDSLIVHSYHGIRILSVSGANSTDATLDVAGAYRDGKPLLRVGHVTDGNADQDNPLSGPPTNFFGIWPNGTGGAILTNNTFFTITTNALALNTVLTNGPQRSSYVQLFSADNTIAAAHCEMWASNAAGWRLVDIYSNSTVAGSTSMHSIRGDIDPNGYVYVTNKANTTAIKGEMIGR